MTVFRLLYPLTRLQYIIHRYITYPWLNAAPSSLPSNQEPLQSALISICQFNTPRDKKGNSVRSALLQSFPGTRDVLGENVILFLVVAARQDTGEKEKGFCSMA